MGRIYSVKVRERFEVMNLLTSGVITESQAAEQLSLSLRQVQRLKERFISEGKTIESLLFHREHPQVNKIPDSVYQKVILLKQQGSHRSCQHIVELLPPLLSKKEKDWFIKWQKPHFHLSYKTVENILKQAGIYEKVYEKTDPARRFEMENFGELAQMDTSSFKNLCGYKRLYLILILDDHSRRILAGRFFLADSVYNNMLVLREAIERYGLFKMLYTDNASLFTYIRHKDYSWKAYRGQLHFYESKVNPEEIVTEIEEALLELGIPVLPHYPGHPRAKGKIERKFSFIGRRFVEEVRGKVNRLFQLNSAFQTWINWYNYHWKNRDTKCTPEERKTPSVFKPLPKEINLDDVFCLKDIRKVDKTNSFSYQGKTYTLNHKNNLVAFKVELHIHPEKKIRVFHQGKLMEELPW